MSLREMLRELARKDNMTGYKYSVNDRFDSMVIKKDRFMHVAQGHVCCRQDNFHIEWGRIIRQGDGFKRGTTLGINKRECFVSGLGITVNNEFIGLD
jgi:hypothetical protein